MPPQDCCGTVRPVDQIKRPGRPRTGVTPKRNIRVGQIWDDAARIAADRGETMTAVIERALQRYVARHRGTV